MYVISGQNYRFMSCQRQFWWKDVNSFPPSLSSCLCMEYTIDNVITWQCLNTLNLFLLLCSFFTNASNTSNCVVQRWILFQQNRLTFRNKLQKFTHTHRVHKTTQKHPRKTFINPLVVQPTYKTHHHHQRTSCFCCGCASEMSAFNCIKNKFLITDALFHKVPPAQPSHSHSSILCGKKYIYVGD